MGSSLIMVGDTSFDVDVLSYEVSQNKYKDKSGIVAVFDIKPGDDKQDPILSAWSVFSDKVISSLKSNDIGNTWEDPTFKLSAEENLQNSIMQQFRTGDQEINIAINAMILATLNAQTIPPTKTTNTSNTTDATDKDTSNTPSKVGISSDRVDSIDLIDAVPIDELSLMRTTKSVNVISKNMLVGFTTGKPIPLTTSKYSGIDEVNLEKAVRDLISQEVLKSKGKPLYITKEPRVIFDKKDNSKFVIRETIEVCTPNGKTKI